jgi:hypothetical protein
MAEHRKDQSDLTVESEAEAADPILVLKFTVWIPYQLSTATAYRENSSGPGLVVASTISLLRRARLPSFLA